MSFPGQPPRLRPVYYSSPLYFVTFCVHKRRPLLACDAVMKAFVAFCSSAEQHNIGVGRFVIMPDHAHLFVRGHPEFHLGRWVGQLKQHIGRALPAESATGVLWQRGFFDHVLRNSESYSEKWRYVSNNPVRHGHVTRPEDWPCAGEIMRIDRA